MLEKYTNKVLLFINKNKKRNIIFLCVIILVILSIIISLIVYNKTSTNYVLKNFNSDIIGSDLDYIKSIDHNNMIKSSNDDGTLSYGHRYNKDIFNSKNKWDNNVVTYDFSDEKLCKYSIAYMSEDDTDNEDTNDHLLEVENYFMDKYGDAECISSQYSSTKKYTWKTNYGYITVYTICDGIVSISLAKEIE